MPVISLIAHKKYLADTITQNNKSKRVFLAYSLLLLALGIATVVLGVFSSDDTIKKPLYNTGVFIVIVGIFPFREYLLKRTKIRLLKSLLDKMHQIEKDPHATNEKEIKSAEELILNLKMLLALPDDEFEEIFQKERKKLVKKNRGYILINIISFIAGILIVFAVLKNYYAGQFDDLKKFFFPATQILQQEVTEYKRTIEKLKFSCDSSSEALSRIKQESNKLNKYYLSNVSQLQDTIKVLNEGILTLQDSIRQHKKNNTITESLYKKITTLTEQKYFLEKQLEQKRLDSIATKVILPAELPSHDLVMSDFVANKMIVENKILISFSLAGLNKSRKSLNIGKSLKLEMRLFDIKGNKYLELSNGQSVLSHSVQVPENKDKITFTFSPDKHINPLKHNFLVEIYLPDQKTPLFTQVTTFQ